MGKYAIDEDNKPVKCLICKKKILWENLKGICDFTNGRESGFSDYDEIVVAEGSGRNDGPFFHDKCWEKIETVLKKK